MLAASSGAHVLDRRSDIVNFKAKAHGKTVSISGTESDPANCGGFLLSGPFVRMAVIEGDVNNLFDLSKWAGIDATPFDSNGNFSTTYDMFLAKFKKLKSHKKYTAVAADNCLFSNGFADLGSATFTTGGGKVVVGLPTDSSVGVCDASGKFDEAPVTTVADLLGQGYKVAVYVEGHGIGCPVSDVVGSDAGNYHLVSGAFADPTGALSDGTDGGTVVDPYFAQNT